MPEPESLATLTDTAVGTCRLDTLGHGTRGLVVAVLEPRLAARLAARGLVPGTEFEVLRGGDPMLVRHDETRWALAAPEAALVEVDILRRPGKVLPAFLRRLFA